MAYKPVVSVVIPLFNRGNYIAQTIGSVLEQEFTDFEIVVVDDASTDNSVNIVKSFSDNRISLYRHKTNLGISASINDGIKHSRGKYVATLGSDDLFKKTKLTKQVEYLERNNNAGAVFSYADIINQQGRSINDSNEYYRHFQRKNLNRFYWLNYFFYNDNCLCAPSSLVRKTCHEEVGLYDERYQQLQDYDFWIRMLLKYEIYIIPEFLTKYRVLNRGANNSAIKAESIIRISWEKLNILNNFISGPDSSDIFKIFPEFQQPATDKKNVIPAFIVASLALKQRSHIHNIFALNILFDLLQSKSTAGKIARAYDFTYGDLIKLTGKVDPFNSEQTYKNISRYYKYNVKNKMAFLKKIFRLTK